MNCQDPLRNIISVYSLEWLLTKACNLRCSYCVPEKPAYEQLDYSKTVREIIRLAPRYIWIGGGEPTLVRQLPEIVRELKAGLQVHIGLNTNLTLIEPAAGIIPYVDDFIVSLDTADTIVSKKIRGVDPDVIIDRIRQLVSLKKKYGYPVNICVNSTVHRDCLDGDGISSLNDRLRDIDPRISHMFCPVLPEEHSGSIIRDQKAAAVFVNKVNALKQKRRTVLSPFSFPVERAGMGTNNPRCYRRYFRLMVLENGMPLSPCPPADISDPSCAQPCNCSNFIDDVVLFKDIEKIRCSILAGKLSAWDVEQLRQLHRERMGLQIPDDLYDILLQDERDIPRASAARGLRVR